MIALTSYQVHEVIGYVLGLLIMCCLVGLCALPEVWRQWRLERWYRQATQRSVREARFAIRDIRRRAIRELVEAEREYRNADGYGEVIEGTAVEVRSP